MTPSQIHQRLSLIPQKPCDMVLDTDTYNEIDDQFALAYALLAKDAMNCQAVYAAPFHNVRSEGPADGMQKSFEEIERVCTALGMQPQDGIYKGSTRWMRDAEDSVESAARDDLIKRAMQRSPEDEPLYVVAIGAPTNVASAIVKEPAICERIVVVWLGANASWHHTFHEFNCQQDYWSSRTLYEAPVPFVRVPCVGCADMLLTTHAEMRELCNIDHPVSDYLLKIYNDYAAERRGLSKVIWDISAVAWLINRDWFQYRTCSSPVLHQDMRVSFDDRRHPTIECQRLNRDQIFSDLFTRIESLVESGKELTVSQ